MVIIEEVNRPAEKKKEIEKIWELINKEWIDNNLDFGLLPKEYHIEQTSDSLSIVKGKVFKETIAELKLRNDIIEVNFTDEKDLEKLRECFRTSRTKFRLIVGDNYY